MVKKKNIDVKVFLKDRNFLSEEQADVSPGSTKEKDDLKREVVNVDFRLRCSMTKQDVIDFFAGAGAFLRAALIATIAYLTGK